MQQHQIAALLSRVRPVPSPPPLPVPAERFLPGPVAGGRGGGRSGKRPGTRRRRKGGLAWWL